MKLSKKLCKKLCAALLMAALILPSATVSASILYNYQFDPSNPEYADIHLADSGVTFGKNKGTPLLMVDGDLVQSDALITRNNRTLAPARAVGEMLGAKVDWNSNLRVVKVSKGSTTVELTIGSSQAKVNGSVKPIEAPAMIYENSTYVPIRIIAESLGAKVDFFNKDPFAFCPIVWVESAEYSAKPDHTRAAAQEALIKELMVHLNTHVRFPAGSSEYNRVKIYYQNLQFMYDCSGYMIFGKDNSAAFAVNKYDLKMYHFVKTNSSFSVVPVSEAADHM